VPVSHSCEAPMCHFLRSLDRTRFEIEVEEGIVVDFGNEISKGKAKRPKLKTFDGLKEKNLPHIFRRDSKNWRGIISNGSRFPFYSKNVGKSYR
jgi:hypothetical protein